MRLLLVFVALAALGCERHETDCNNDKDDDQDGLVDCADPDCFLAQVCQPCGDGHLDDDEECDDGNNKDGDGCSARCVLEHCGDGVVDAQFGEQCDHGATNGRDGDNCNVRCQITSCGDGVVERGEQCDDGNQHDGDGCSHLCKNESSGSLCGNGVIDPGEQCDNGAFNGTAGDGCSTQCRQEFCGDGIREPEIGEQCDGNDGTPPGAECVNCQILHCGNGVVEPQFGEQCDDGNQNFGDGCSNCQKDRCGDGFISFALAEQCDDGNLVDGDGCSHLCKSEFCGDGVVQLKLGELCDRPGNAECSQCTPLTACTGTLCYDVSRDHPFLLPTSAALQAGHARAFFASPNSSLVRYDLVVTSTNSAFQNGPFSVGSFSSIAIVAAGDIDGDGNDEVFAASIDGFVGKVDDNGNFSASLDVAELVVDLSIGAIGGAATKDVVAIGASNGLSPQIGVIIDDARTHHAPLPFVAERVLAEPFVAVGGTHIQPMHLDASEEIAFDARVEATLPLVDLAGVDVDGDGVIDLVGLANAPDELLAWPSAAGGLAGTPIVLANAPGASRLSAADVDGDGVIDLITAGDGAITLHLASASFAPSDKLPGPVSPTRVAARDIDGDGDVDLLVGGGQFNTDALLLLRQ